MMKLLAVVTITLAVAFASQHPKYEYEWLEENTPEYGIEHNQYSSGKEFQYIYNGQLMTGIPESSDQHSATRIQAIVSVVFDGQQEMRMQMRHIRFASLNERVSSPRNLQPFELFEPIELVDKHLQTLRLPVKCEYTNGLVTALTFDGAEQPWSANIKRAVLNMLQVNLHKKNEERQGQTEMFLGNEGEGQKFIADGDFFVAREDSMEGNCATTYTIGSTPLENARQYKNSVYDVLNVTKSIDFDRCLRRPTLRYNFRVAEICPTCEERYTTEDKMLRASTVIRQSLLVEKRRSHTLLVERAVVESQYTYVPYTEEGSVIQTYVNMTLELVKSSNTINSIPQLSSPIVSDSNLIATMDMDLEKEEYFMTGEGEFAKNTAYSQIDDKVAFCKNLLEKTVHYMRESVEEEAPRQFARLVKVMRTMQRSEIEQIFTQFVKQSPFTKEESQKVQSLVIDALALAGTKDTLYFLVEQIERKQISALRAALVLRKFTQIRTVSEQMIEKVWSLTKGGRCEENKMVCQGAMLTVGSMLNAICKPNQDLLAVDFASNHPLASVRQCGNEIKNKWAQRMIEQLEQSKETVSRIVCLKMIGNAGLVNTIERLNTIIVGGDERYTPLERVEAIMALRQFVHTEYTIKVQKVLIPLYLDVTTPQQIRIAALHIVLATQPEKSIVDQLTRALMVEENKQVAAFTFTAMNSLSKSTIPCEKRFAKDLTLSLRNAPFLQTSSWTSFSKLIRTQYHSEKYNQGFAAEYTSIMSNSSSLPMHMGVNMDLHLANIWMKNLGSAGFVQQNVEQFMRDIVRKMSHELMTPIESLFGESNSESSSEGTSSGTSEEESLRQRAQRRISPKFASSLEKIFKDLSIEDRRGNSEDVSILAFYLRQANQDQAFIPITKEILSEQWLNVLTSSSEEMTLEKMIKRARKLLSDVTLPFDLHHATFLQETSRKIVTVLGLPLQVTIKTPVVMQARGQIKIDFDAKNPMRKFAVHLKEIKPSMTVSYVQKVECWSPIVNSALKVVSSVHMNTPFSSKVAINMVKSQPQMTISYEPINKSVDVLRVTSRPVTSVLVWPKSLRQWKEADQKTIVGGEASELTTMDKKYGENALGLEISAYGRWNSKVSAAPYSLFAGANKFVVNVKPGFEMPKEYKMIVSGKLFERVSNGKMGQQMKNFYTASDEILDVSAPFSQENQDMSSIFEESASQESAEQFEGVNPTRHQLKFVFETTGSPIKREAVVETQIECGDLNKACTYKLNVRRTAIPRSEETKEWKMESEMSTLYPEAPKDVNELKDRKYMNRVVATWGKGQFVDMKLVGEQSEKLEQLVQQSIYSRSWNNKEDSRKSIYSPVAQREHTLKYGLLDQYKIDADYNVSPAFCNLSEKVLEIVKYWYYYETSVAYRQPFETKGRQQIRARFTIDPINRQYCNVTIETPSELISVKDIELPIQVRGVNIRSQQLEMPALWERETNLAICQLRSDRVNTFDDVKYSTVIPQCFTLLTKDCYAQENSKFAVFVKEGQNEQKTLKIVSQNIKLIVSPVSDNEFMCEINGVQMDCSEIEDIFVHGKHLALRVTKNEYLKIDLPEAGIRVYFDGLSVNVKTSNHFRGQLCGLCGQWDQEERCDLINNKRECLSANVPSEVRDFVKSYIVDEQCQIPEEMERYTYTPLSWEDNKQNVAIYQGNSQRVSSYQTEMKPQYITRVIEQRDQICFSKQPVYRCPTNTRAVEHDMTQTKVTYACINRYAAGAERMERLAYEQRVVAEVADLTASFTHQLYQPIRCVRL
jgi:hypothetical protein